MTDLPGDDASLAWKRLSAKYDSKSMTVVVGLYNEFNKAKLISLSINPEDWMMELEILQAHLGAMNYPITDKHLMVHIMYNLLKKYNSVIKADVKFINDTTNLLNIKTPKDHLHIKWEKLFGKRTFPWLETKKKRWVRL